MVTYTEAEMAPFATVAEAAAAGERYLNTRLRRHTIRLIADRIEDTFGPNPCTRLTLQNAETGETINRPCDTKRCPDCGPRKLATMEAQLRTLGNTIWVATTHNRTELDRALERAKKQHQRNNIDYTYQIVGDDYLGYIITSDTQLLPQQRLSYLNQWTDRIKRTYQYADNRIRRSNALGRMSLVPLLTRGKQGTSTSWRFLSQQVKHVGWAVRGKIRDDMANMEKELAAWITTKEPDSTLTALPDPY